MKNHFLGKTGLVLLSVLLALISTSSAADPKSAVYQEGEVNSINHIDKYIVIDDIVFALSNTLSVYSKSKRRLSRYSLRQDQVVAVSYQYKEDIDKRMAYRIVILEK